MSSSTQATNTQYFISINPGALSPSTQVPHSQNPGPQIVDRTKGISNIALEIVHSPELSARYQVPSYLLFLNGKKVVDGTKPKNRRDLILKGTVKAIFEMLEGGGIKIIAQDLKGVAHLIIQEPTKCSNETYSAVVFATRDSLMFDPNSSYELNLDLADDFVNKS